MDTSRIRRAVAREGMDFLGEFLCPAEIDRCRRTRYPLPAAALLFAAKEALFKALGTGRSGRISWHDVEVSGLGKGREVGPSLKLAGEAFKIARKLGVTGSCLTWSRLKECAEFAVATVVLEGTRGKRPAATRKRERIRRGKRV
jgi:holo-[acyl-carrier protein] synthase